MSIKTINSVWEHSQSKGRARLVLIAIADHQGEIGAWPSLETLGKMVNASPRSVQRDIDELVKLGELIVERHKAPTRERYKPNLYWVNLPGTDPQGTTNSPQGTTELAQGTTNLDQGTTTVGVQTLIEPLRETLKEPSSRLPENWQPRKEDWLLMEEHFPSLDLKLETHSFRDYWNSVPGAKGRKSDWNATWRNWMRNAYKRSKPKNPNQDILERWKNELS